MFQTIQKLLALDGGDASHFAVSTLAIHSSSFLLLFILAYGIAAPGGIFMPSIMASGIYSSWLFYWASFTLCNVMACCCGGQSY